MLHVNSTCSIREDELTFTAARASGPGGQHVNTASTAVTVGFNVAASTSLTEPQRRRVLEKLAPRLTTDGRLLVTAQDRRSQLANREAATRRLLKLLARALHTPKPRQATKPSKASRQRRLDNKKRRSELKRQRGKPD